MPGSEWDARYADEEYLYGTEPNDFLREVVVSIPASGRVLSIADGEGRNGVFLASLGHRVVTVDGSTRGIEKAQKLAAARGVSIEMHHADLAEWSIPEGEFDGIVSIFCHLPSALRRKVHAQVVKGLRPGGVFVLEAYSPAQLANDTGGPKNLDMLYAPDALRDDLRGLDLEICREVTRDVQEGTKHTGMSVTVQVLARRPRAS